jgi:hypothetical protein
MGPGPIEDITPVLISISKIMATRFHLDFHLFDGLENTYQAWNGIPQQYIESDQETTIRPERRNP